MKQRKVCVRTPASTANLGPGFDTLGMALDLHAWIEMSFSAQSHIQLIGEQLHGVEATKSNLIYQSAQQVFAQAGADHPEIDISVYSEIPLARGLGSSASAIVGGMVAANELLGCPLSQDQIFQLAVKAENHPDNVGASLFGGSVVASWDGVRAEAVRIEPDPRLEALVVVPEFHLPTEKARHILPQQVSMRDAVFNTSHASLLVAALIAGDLGKIGYAMRDALHQPYRAPLIPGMNEILDHACDHGALGVALSGAGPSLLALVDGKARPDRRALETFMLNALEQAGIQARAMWMKPSPAGVRVLTPDRENSTFIDEIKLRQGEVGT